jgi:hypothetical protein
MVENRRFNYEVFVCVEGRWQFDCVVEDEEVALTQARFVLATGRFEEVKVVRNRTMMTGFTTKTDVFHETRPVVREQPLAVRSRIDRAYPCETLDDIYGLESRRIVSRLFRQFLDKFQITATELLHNWTYARKLSETGNMIWTATHQVAMTQAREQEVNGQTRLHLLDGLVQQAMRQVRDSAAERRGLPAFDPDQIDYVSSRIRAHVGPDNHAFMMLCQISQYLMGCGSIGGKLERMLDLWTGTTDPGLAELFECFVADALTGPDIIRELIGPQPNLAASLVILADILTGRTEKAKLNANLSRIARLIAHGQAPSCHAILLDRLRAELKRDHPLDRKQPDNDTQLLEQVITRLRGDDGNLLGGPEVEEAVIGRMVRQRQTMLRGMGLLDVADQLPMVWRPRLM